MKRRRYRIEWRLGRRRWTWLGSPSGHIDTFTTKADARRALRRLRYRNPFVQARIVAPPSKEHRHG